LKLIRDSLLSIDSHILTLIRCRCRLEIVIVVVVVVVLAVLLELRKNRVELGSHVRLLRPHALYERHVRRRDGALQGPRRPLAGLHGLCNIPGKRDLGVRLDERGNLEQRDAERVAVRRLARSRRALKQLWRHVDRRALDARVVAAAEKEALATSAVNVGLHDARRAKVSQLEGLTRFV
jgi:hypothetical protein